MSRLCSVCNYPMYEHSDGRSVSCRNFDCPPGTSARYAESWRLAKEFAPQLRKMPAGEFTVEEIALINRRDHSGINDGFTLRKIYARVSEELKSNVQP